MASVSVPVLITHGFTRSWVKELLIVLLSANLIALTGPLSIPLPFTPVPIAVQCQVVLAMAVLLGSRRAFFAVLAFLFEGVIGLPVFSQGRSGLIALLGPTGGYLLGYAAAAYVTGLIAEKLKERTSLKLFSAMAMGNAVIFLFGLPWLAQYVGFPKAFVLGVLPFIPGDLIKLVFATKWLKRLKGS